MADPMAVIERHLAAWNAHDGDADPWSADAELVTPDGRARGREQILDWLQGYWDAFPDARNEIVRSIGSGAHVAAEGTMTGTHTGTLATADGDVPPTGRRVEIRWMAMYETAGDEIVSEHSYFDQMQFLTQLGLAPAANGEGAAGQG